MSYNSRGARLARMVNNREDTRQSVADLIQSDAIREGFCPLCDVTLDLHDGPGSCSAAIAKADLLRQFFAIFGVPR